MFNKRSVVNRRWFVRLMLLSLVMAGLTGGLLWVLVNASSVGAVQARVLGMKPFFTGLRVFLMALVAAAWPIIIKQMAHSGMIKSAQAEVLCAERWRLVTWLVVIELVLGQNLLGRVLELL